MDTVPERKFTAEELAIIKRNVLHFQEAFRDCPDSCQAPGCGYPLDPAVGHFYCIGVGHICDTCHSMFAAVRTSRYFVDIDAAYQREKRRRQE